MGKNGTTGTKGKSLTLDEFLHGGQPKQRLVPTPEFTREDGTVPEVVIRALTAGEQDIVAAEQASILNVDQRTVETHSRSDDIRARVLSWCVLDSETLKPLFTPKHVFEIQQKDASVVSRWYAVVLKLSEVTAEEVDKIVNLFPKTRAGT